MMSHDTISIQEVRRDPLAFFQQLRQGKTVTVIYRSKPLVTLSANDASEKDTRSIPKLLELAKKARDSGTATLDPNLSYKDIYGTDTAKKYDIS